MASNTAVNFAFGAAEGAIIGAATAVNPALGVGALVLVGLYEFFSKARDTVKNAINSLD